MAKILICGNAPLPTEKEAKKQYAAGLRTWHFIKPLLDAGHQVLLFALVMPDAYKDALVFKKPQTEVVSDQLTIIRVDKGWTGFAQFLHKQFRTFRPDCALGINTYPSYRATTLARHCPFWADLNGWLMAEAQSQAGVIGSDVYLPHYAKIEQTIVRWADKFSAVSEFQKWALIGELALAGRMNSKTDGYEFATSIPNANETIELHQMDDRKLLRGKVAAEDDFIVFSAGGYNTWLDIDTLFTGLGKAMDKNPKIKFVSTGGKIPGLADSVFDRFIKMIDGSKHKDRFVMLGWVPSENMPYYYREANVGINCDRFNYETLTGARNRLNEMMIRGLPVVTTLGSEITHDIKSNDLGFTYDIGDSDGLADLLVSLVGRDLSEYTKRAADFAKQYYSYKYTTRAVAEWVKNPKKAPDFGYRVSLRGGKLASGLRYMREKGIRASVRKIVKM